MQQQRYFKIIVFRLPVLLLTILSTWSDLHASDGDIIASLENNSKLLYPEEILSDFRNRELETSVIITLKSSEAANNLALQSQVAGQIPAAFQQPGAPPFYNLKDLSIRSQLRKTVTETIARVIGELGPSEMVVTNRFLYQFGFAATVSPAALERIVNHSQVERITKNRPLKKHLGQGIPLMNATTARSTYDGSGLSIAICDTGIDTSHPMLGNGGSPIFNSKVIGGYDTGDDDADPRPNSTSGDAHGTACAGISAGDIGTTGDYIGGVAPGAKLYAYKISYGNTGSSGSAAMIDAWNRAIADQYDDPSNPIMVISTSFGGGRETTTCDGDVPDMTTAAANAVAAGITIFVSSGNDGYCDAVGWPACITTVNAVGAVYDANIGQNPPLGYVGCISTDSCTGFTDSCPCTTGNCYIDATTAADQVTTYSNSASFLTMFAPSNNAYTTDIVGSGGYTTGDYDSSFGGTSAACPYAAGAAAVLQSAAMAENGSFLTPAQVQQYLVNYGDLVIDSKTPIPQITKPRINVGNAITALVPPTFLLTVNKTGSGSGVVTSNPVGISCGTDCTENYDSGEAVTLTSAASTGSTFTGWSGEGCSGTGTCVVTTAAVRTVTADFTINTYTLDVTKSGTGLGTITSSPVGINCGSDCTEDYDYNTLVTLSATESTGSTFSGWSGGGCSGTGTCQVTMDQAHSIDAEFTINTYDLTVSKDGTGTGTVTSDIAGINCGADCTETYNFNTVITLSAAADAGSGFTGWTGGGCSGTGTCIVTMDQHQNITATFLLDPQSLSVIKAGTGNGTVTSSPGGINCGSDCSEMYSFNEAVTLTATENISSNFSGWSGDCSGTGTCNITMNMARAVTASFSLRTFSVTPSPGTNGSLSPASPQTVNYGATSSFNIIPDQDYHIENVSGCSGTLTGNTYTTGPITADCTVSATFALDQYELNVSLVGNGKGNVSSSPAGIDCETDCTETYGAGTPVTLTAVPGIWSDFAGWSGGCIGLENTCALTMDQAYDVNAEFTKIFPWPMFLPSITTKTPQ